MAWLLIRGLAAKHRTTVPPRMVPDLMVYVLMGVLVGGRLGYCVFYDPPLLYEFTRHFPYWGVLAIHRMPPRGHPAGNGIAKGSNLCRYASARWIVMPRPHQRSGKSR